MSTITDSTKNIFGYVTFYLKYTSNDSVYYAKFCSDFKPPISEALFLSVLERVKTIYEHIEMGFVKKKNIGTKRTGNGFH